MSRVNPRPPHGLDLFRRYAYRAGRRMYGFELEPTAVIAHSKPALTAFGVVGMAVEKSARVQQRHKSLAMLRTAQLTGCEWCLDFGSRHAQNNGVPAEDLRELSLWRDSPRFDAVDRLVLAYAEAMTQTPVSVTDAQVAALREHFDERQLVELTLVIAAENLFSRTNWALGIEGQGFSEGMYCVTPAAAASSPAVGAVA